MKKEKLNEGDELIYTDGKTLMEKLKVESIDKKGGYALLSNRVKIYRTLSIDKYSRIDGKTDQYCLPITEENEKLFEAYKAHHSIKRSIDYIQGRLKNKDIKNDNLIRLNKKLSKLVESIKEE